MELRRGPSLWQSKNLLQHQSENTGAFLTKQISDLTDHAEKGIIGYTGVRSAPAPWKVSDAPESYIHLLKKAIIGIEIQIERMEGKFKTSQEMGDSDNKGVIEGFRIWAPKMDAILPPLSRREHR